MMTMMMMMRYKNKFPKAQSPMDLINGSLAWHQPPGANAIHQVWDKGPNLDQGTQFSKKKKYKYKYKS